MFTKQFLSIQIISRWNEIIGSSSTTMKFFYLHLSFDWHSTSKYNEIMTLERTFQSLRANFDLSKDLIALFTQVSLRYGWKVKDLSLGRVCISDFQDLIESLEHFVMLDKLTLFDIKHHKSNEEESNPIKTAKLSNLKCLKVQDCSWDVFQFLDAPIITDLEISQDFFRTFINQHEHQQLINFLRRSCHLKSFRLVTPVPTPFPFKVFPLILKKIDLHKDDYIQRMTSITSKCFKLV